MGHSLSRPPQDSSTPTRHELTAAAGARHSGTSSLRLPSRLVLIPVDDQGHSRQALEWAVRHIYRRDQHDQLCLLSVVPRVAGPYPVEVLEADVPAASSSTVKAWRCEQKAHESETEALLSFMQHHAVNLGVQASDVTTACLAADGGASGVGASIARHAADSHADMLVLGSRGLQGWQRQVANLLGLGSVSYYTLLHVACPVVVVKGDGGSDS